MNITATITIKQPNPLDLGDLSDLLDIDPIHARKFADEFELILDDDLDGDVHKLLGRASSALDNVMDAVRPMIKAGASLHWLVPFEKRPIATEWSQAPFQTETNLRATYRRDANVGIRPGEPSKVDGLYLHIVDLDIRKPEMAAEAWAALLALWPAAKTFPSVISGSSGESRHLYFLSSKSFRKTNLAKSKGEFVVEEKGRQVRKRDWEIDLMGTDSQAVIPPSIHPDTKLPYRWERQLELDFTMLMEVSSSVIEGWGARQAAAVVDDEDEDDLFTLIRTEPMDLSDEQIDDVLAHIPNDGAGAHYDDYVQAGMAMHRQFQGSAEGFERWREWASQSAKFDQKNARLRWRSFKTESKNPVRMATLIQIANNNRLSDDLDFEDDFDAAPIAAALPAPAAKYDLSDLLGPAPLVRSPPMVTWVAKSDDDFDYEADWQQLLHRNEEGELKSTLHNVSLLTEYDRRTRSAKQFNQFKNVNVMRVAPRRAVRKREKGKPVINLDGPHWNVSDPVNGDPLTDTHYNDIRRMIEAPTMQGGYGIKVSDRDLYAAIDSVA